MDATSKPFIRLGGKMKKNNGKNKKSSVEVIYNNRLDNEKLGNEKVKRSERTDDEKLAKMSPPFHSCTE